MDLHIYRSSQDRRHDLKAAARDRGAVLAFNAVTLDELVRKLTPEASVASAGQRLVLIESAVHRAEAGAVPGIVRYAYDAIDDVKGACVRSSELREAGAELLARIMDEYDDLLRAAGLVDPQDQRLLAASSPPLPPGEGAAERRVRGWLRRFNRVVLHALYDLNEAEFRLIRGLIEVLPEGGMVMLFNTTANVKPTQFAEWTWQRFIQDESLAEKTFPEFCRPLHPNRAVLERLFVFDNAQENSGSEPLGPDPSLRILEAPGRYREIESIGSEIADLLASGETASEIAVVVRHIETYGEMIEDVFSRYGIPHAFETGVPLLRIPFIKYWFSLLDLVAGERSRDALGRVMASAYYEPRLSPRIDVEKDLASFGYLDRNHLRASALAMRKASPLAPELLRLEQWLDKLEAATESVSGFLEQLQPAAPLTGRDGEAWQSLAEELEAVDAVAGAVSFAQFRRTASQIAGMRTVDRASGSGAPPGLPRVRVMPPSSLGYRGYRWIYAPGLADGEFPARSSSNPLLPAEIVDELNRSIRPRRLMSPRDRNRREPLFLFMILDSASERVTLTYPGSTLEGETIYPSIYIGEITRHYAVSPLERLERSLPVREAGECLRKIADEWRSGAIEDEAAERLLTPDIVRRARWEAKGVSRGDIGRSVLPIDMAWHPSELNSLAACPFVFLARHRLKLRTSGMPDFEVPASEVGILAHTILRDFYAEPVPPSLEQARDRIEKIIAQRLANVDINGQGAYSVFDPALWQIRRRQLVSALLRYMEFAVRDAIDGFETLPEYLDMPLPQARLGQTLLGGKPDHVAVLRTGDRIDGIRIDDFKYSAASGSTTRQLRQSMQIPVYAYLALRAMGVERAGPGVRIEGRYLLLRSPSNPVVSYPIDESVFDDVRVRIEHLLGKVEQGRLHADPADTQDCPNCDYRRLCRIS